MACIIQSSKHRNCDENYYRALHSFTFILLTGPSAIVPEQILAGNPPLWNRTFVAVSDPL